MYIKSSDPGDGWNRPRAMTEGVSSMSQHNTPERPRKGLSQLAWDLIADDMLAVQAAHDVSRGDEDPEPEPVELPVAA